MKVGEGLVLFQVDISLVPKGAFFFCQALPVIDKCVHDFILLQGYFNTILLGKTQQHKMLDYSVQ